MSTHFLNGLSSWLQLFRVLIPSWRFFGSSFAVPILWVKYIYSDQTESLWQKRLKSNPSVAPGRPWKRLWLNSEENHLLSCQALLSQLEIDLATPSSEPSVSAQLVQRLALLNLPGDPHTAERKKAEQIQYRITFPHREDYLSPLYDANRTS